MASNINNIPLAGIERVEVLKDGASAIYGADAIAGVINFIMASNYQGAEVNMYASAPTRSGGGQNYQPSAVLGFGDYNKDRYNFTFTAQYSNQQALFAKDRDFAKTGNVFPYITAGATGQGNIEGGYRPGTGSAANGTWVEGTRIAGFGASPGTGYGNPLAANGQCPSILMFRNPTDSTKGAPYCTYDSATAPNLVPANINTGLTGNFKYKLSDNVELFADALWSENVLTNKIQPSPVRRSFLTPADTLFPALGIDPVLLIYPSNPNYALARNYLQFAAGVDRRPGDRRPEAPLAITRAGVRLRTAYQRGHVEPDPLLRGRAGQLDEAGLGGELSVQQEPPRRAP